MSYVNYLSPLPQMPNTNKYNASRNQVNNSNFSKVLESQKKIDKPIGKEQYIVRDFINNVKNTNIAAADKNGTNIAVKELAVDMEQQFLAYMWNLAFSSTANNSSGDIGEVIFQKELIDEIVKTSNNGEMGDIAEDIYEEVLRLEGIKSDSGIEISKIAK